MFLYGTSLHKIWPNGANLGTSLHKILPTVVKCTKKVATFMGVYTSDPINDYVMTGSGQVRVALSTERMEGRRLKLPTQ